MLTNVQLTSYLSSQLALFPGKIALRLADLETGAVLFDQAGESRVVSASLIKVPILLAALDQVQEGRLALEQEIPVSPSQVLADTESLDLGQSACPLVELLYWMIAASDNTATNVLIDLLGYGTINDYITQTLGLKETQLQRKMLDWDAIHAGKNNYTSAADQHRLFHLLCHEKLLTPPLTETAIHILARQRDGSMFQRYLADDVLLPHKTGTLDHVFHDVGVFLLPHCNYFLAILTWDGPSLEGDPRQKQLIGRLAKSIYDVYKESL
jgi:beta-lactamase class A